MSVTFITPTDITPGPNGSWTDVDVTSHVSVDATGVMLEIYSTIGSVRDAGARRNGDTTDFISNLDYHGKSMVCVGVDDNKIIEIYKSTADIYVYIHGYFEGEATFFSTPIDVSPSGAGAFEDTDISSDTGSDTATIAIVSVQTTNNNRNDYFRANGSTDDFSSTHLAGNVTFLVPCDENEIYETKLETLTTSIPYLVGYMTDGATFYTNAVDETPASSGSFVDLSALPAGALGAHYSVIKNSGGSDRFDLRKKGSSRDNNRLIHYKHSTYSSECDSNGIVQGFASASTVAIYEKGYFTTVAAALISRKVIIS